MNWLILIVAGLFEVVWATALKMSNGLRNVAAAVALIRRSELHLLTLSTLQVVKYAP